jgi:hypothetical protein
MAAASLPGGCCGAGNQPVIMVCGTLGFVVGRLVGMWVVAALYLLRRRFTSRQSDFHKRDLALLVGMPPIVAALPLLQDLFIPGDEYMCRQVYLLVAVLAVLMVSFYPMFALIAWYGRRSRAR